MKDIELIGSKVVVVRANIAVYEDPTKLDNAALAISESGNIDIFVHNAATGDA